MGLDQYMYKRTHLNTESFVKEEFRDAITLTKGGKPHPKIKSENITYVVEEVGYWRKANHIHKWFVDNVQKGIDDCREYRVSEDQLKQLLETCKEVLSAKDDEVSSRLLPTSSGFFFGETGYSEYYYEDIENTIGIIEGVFDLDEDTLATYVNGDIYYESSW